jgi:AcrR family transcriptional regulator
MAIKRKPSQKAGPARKQIRPAPVTQAALAVATPADTPLDGRRERGLRSRSAVLERSVQLASREGLEGLTIGALAADLGVHKSNVYASFGSKEELQLATLACARAILIDQVVMPGATAEEGLPRLIALGEAWCDYLASDLFEGGCFLCAASAEMDGRPGAVRDAVGAVMREWLGVLAANVDAAIAAGQLVADIDSGSMAFRLNALGMAANWQRQLLDDPAGIEHARSAWRAELDRNTRDHH